MAGLNHQLKASTLVESLIAMVILVVCLGIGTMVFTNVLTSDKERKRLHATLLANEEAAITKAQHTFLDSEEKAGDWTLKKTIEKYENTANLFLLSIAVLDNNNKIVYIRKELITVNE
jgi:Tfp pilus assembly protein PilV